MLEIYIQTGMGVVEMAMLQGLSATDKRTNRQQSAKS
jgi:hypothetical protein